MATCPTIARATACRRSRARSCCSTPRPARRSRSSTRSRSRCGAGTAVAARYLARLESRVATIYGCGAQARVQLAALRHVLDIRQVFLVDRDAAAAQAFAGEITGLDVDVPAVPRQAARASDV